MLWLNCMLWFTSREKIRRQGLYGRLSVQFYVFVNQALQSVYVFSSSLIDRGRNNGIHKSPPYFPVKHCCSEVLLLQPNVSSDDVWIGQFHPRLLREKGVHRRSSDMTSRSALKQWPAKRTRLACTKEETGGRLL